MATREELYAAVWSEPLTKLAKRFGVSDSYLARVCKYLDVPRPGRGYWARQDTAKAMPKRVLPPAKAGEPLEWSPGDGLPIGSPSQMSGPVGNLGRNVKKTHPLLRGAATDFNHCRTRIVDSIFANGEAKYLKPYKYNLVDITSSKACLRSAIAFTNTLFLALQAQGYAVRLIRNLHSDLRRPSIDPGDRSSTRVQHSPFRNLWIPKRITAVQVHEQLVGLALVEVSTTVLMRHLINGVCVPDAEYVPPRNPARYVDSTWTSIEEHPSGQLRLIAYAPHREVELTKQWQETDGVPLTESVPSIISGIESMATRLVDLNAQADLKIERMRKEQQAEWHRYEVEQDKRQIQESIQKSRQQLDEIMRQWDHMRARLDFLTSLERHMALLPEPERASLEERLVMARELLGPIDPMAHFLAWRSPVEIYTPKHLDEQEWDQPLGP